MSTPRKCIDSESIGQRGISVDADLCLSRYFGITAQLWLKLQQALELRVAEIESGKDTANILPPLKVCIETTRTINSDEID